MLPPPASLLRYGLASASLIGASALASAAASSLVCKRFDKLHPPRGSFVEAEGCRLHLWEDGPADPRACVLLLHGASGNLADMTLNLAPALVDRYRVIAVDRPGHGWSERQSPQDDCLRAQARVIAQALKLRGVERVIVLGHSWAGALAACFALEHRDVTSAIVLVSAATHPWPGGISWYHRAALDPRISPLFTRTFVAPAVLARIRAAVREIFAPQEPPDNYVERIGAALVTSPSRFLANAQDMQALLEYVTQNNVRYHEIDVPTRLITGDCDAVVPHIHSRAFHEKVGHSTLTILPGVGHMPHHVAVEAVAREVDAAHAQAMAQMMVKIQPAT
ncbi:MAG: alpha/beta hydrolase [Beijerinckiaceae bacterium]|nr:alpha/beta hydrolase [Beijerinckiaceae bacterium]